MTDDVQTGHASKTRTEFNNPDHTRHFDNIDVDMNTGNITREVRVKFKPEQLPETNSDSYPLRVKKKFQSSCHETNCLAQGFRDEGPRAKRRLWE